MCNGRNTSITPNDTYPVSKQNQRTLGWAVLMLVIFSGTMGSVDPLTVVCVMCTMAKCSPNGDSKHGAWWWWGNRPPFSGWHIMSHIRQRKSGHRKAFQTTGRWIIVQNCTAPVASVELLKCFYRCKNKIAHQHLCGRNRSLISDVIYLHSSCSRRGNLFSFIGQVRKLFIYIRKDHSRYFYTLYFRDLKLNLKVLNFLQNRQGTICVH